MADGRLKTTGGKQKMSFYFIKYIPILLHTSEKCMQGSFKSTKHRNFKKSNTDFTRKMKTIIKIKCKLNKAEMNGWQVYKSVCDAKIISYFVRSF